MVTLEKRLSVLKAIRIPETTRDALKSDASENGISVNALINRILMKYVEYDRYAEKFGLVQITQSLLEGLLENISTEQLVELGSKLGRSTPREAALLWYGRVDAQALLHMISMFGKYGKTVECEITSNGHDYTVVFKHDHAEKWSSFITAYWESALEATLKTRPSSETMK